MMGLGDDEAVGVVDAVDGAFGGDRDSQHGEDGGLAVGDGGDPNHSL